MRRVIRAPVGSLEAQRLAREHEEARTNANGDNPSGGTYIAPTHEVANEGGGLNESPITPNPQLARMASARADDSNAAIDALVQEELTRERGEDLVLPTESNWETLKAAACAQDDSEKSDDEQPKTPKPRPIEPLLI